MLFEGPKRKLRENTSFLKAPSRKLRINGRESNNGYESDDGRESNNERDSHTGCEFNNWRGFNDKCESNTM